MDKFPPEAAAALERGDVITAIKIVRDRTGLDLKSAKEAVERFANDGGELGSPADWQEGEWGRGEPPQPGGPAVVPAAALAALARGQKVEAVRLTREATGLGLAQAKDLVESHGSPASTASAGATASTGSIEFAQPPSPVFPSDPMAEPGRVSGGYKWLLIVIVLLVVALVWLYFAKGA